jgi:hypothetical protein
MARLSVFVRHVHPDAVSCMRLRGAHTYVLDMHVVHCTQPCLLEEACAACYMQPAAMQRSPATHISHYTHPPTAFLPVASPPPHTHTPHTPL